MKANKAKLITPSTDYPLVDGYEQATFYMYETDCVLKKKEMPKEKQKESMHSE